VPRSGRESVLDKQSDWSQSQLSDRSDLRADEGLRRDLLLRPGAVNVAGGSREAVEAPQLHDRGPARDGRIAAWARRLKLDFVRWNGGGDLFEESVQCLNVAAALMSDIPQWVVTRLAHHAVNIDPQPNVYVHFSVDKFSWTRLAALRPRDDLQWFWSYQCEPDERPVHPIAPVVFRDGYDPKGDSLHSDDCPLNAAEDITGVCGRCRRCFNGEAVARAKELAPSLQERI
jgi:hypothetical protein